MDPMGLLIEGQWHDQWYDTKKTGGRFVRTEAQFRNKISDEGEFKPESGRYHLYVSYACPWAHRTLIYRSLKDLTQHISVSVVNPIMLENGWTFQPFQDSTEDHLFHNDFLYQVYLRANEKYSGRVTVPILFDKKTDTIVCNESSEIIRMFNKSFNNLTGNSLDFCPTDKLNAIDEINEFVYHNINNGVYKVGFATQQDVYEEELDKLFNALDKIERDLSSNKFLLGNNPLECDWRLFVTLLRFDPVYVGHFKCNLKRILDFPKMYQYIQELKNFPGVQETININHIKTHYYASHPTINPNGIVPKGPTII